MINALSVGVGLWAACILAAMIPLLALYGLACLINDMRRHKRKD